MGRADRRPTGHAASSRRLRLDLSFVGTSFRGWQAQKKGLTVQDALETALRKVEAQATRPLGCSRTDSGVHARRFNAHVDVAASRRLEQLLKGLNTNLPPDIRIHRIAHVVADFHARYQSLGKTYRYFLYMDHVVPPPLAPFVWQWQGPLNEKAMGEASQLFLGEHDFSAFTTAEGRERNCARTIRTCGVERRGPLLVLTVEGPSFLHRMVRCIAGALTGVGTGRLSQVSVERALRGDPGAIIQALPAQALHLWEVHYPEVPSQDIYGEWPEPPSWIFEGTPRVL